MFQEEKQSEVRTGITRALKGQLEGRVKVEGNKKNGPSKCPVKCGSHTALGRKDPIHPRVLGTQELIYFRDEMEVKLVEP